MVEDKAKDKAKDAWGRYPEAGSPRARWGGRRGRFRALVLWFSRRSVMKFLLVFPTWVPTLGRPLRKGHCQDIRLRSPLFENAGSLLSSRLSNIAGRQLLIPFTT